MIRQRIDSFLSSRRATLLGVGPMSQHCVDATIELANDHDIPLILIASRRQIDSEEFGGGYVNQWSTAQFANYVIDRDKRGKVLLARDHGGPWQSELEKKNKLSLRRAMDSAKSSYKADIDAGFQILHIDPSVDIHGTPTTDDVLDRIFELYEYCWTYAQSKGQDIAFEIGTEEQSGSTNTQEELEYTLSKMERFCQREGFPVPSFVVVQTGTRVAESRNVGSFDSPLRVANELPAEIQVPKMVEICNRHNIYMKEHNTDYLSDEALAWHPRLGIHAANVAPEFGVTETRALVETLSANGMQNVAEQFLQLCFSSMKWVKWVLPNTELDDRGKAILCGHYLFAHPEVKQLIEKASVDLSGKGVDLNQTLKRAVKESIARYCRLFQLVKSK